MDAGEEEFLGLFGDGGVGAGTALEGGVRVAGFDADVAVQPPVEADGPGLGLGGGGVGSAKPLTAALSIERSA